jgi:3-oxoacyl-[acyl-carrier protein] reductase
MTLRGLAKERSTAKRMNAGPPAHSTRERSDRSRTEYHKESQVPQFQRTALITGGGRGIGRAAAVEFARAGFDVAIVARSREQLAQTAGEVEKLGRRCVPIRADLATADGPAAAVDDARAELGRIDVLMNNAATAPLGKIEELTVEQFEGMVALNLTAVYATTKAAWPNMKAQRGGVIVNVSSMAAKDPFPGLTAYGATKAAINTLTLGLAGEGKPYDIRVYAIGPGAVETEMLRSGFPDIPAEACLQPADVARVAVLLADPACRYATGEVIYLQKY